MDRAKHYILGILIGVAVMLIFRCILYYSKLNRNWEFETSDILNILIALIVSYYLPISLGKIIDNQKAQKANQILVVDQIERIGSGINDLIEGSITGDAISKENLSSIIITRIRQMGNKIKQLSVINEKIKTLDQSCFKDLIDCHIDFNSLVTENIKNTDFTFDSTYYTLYSHAFETKLVSKLNEIKILILQQ